MGFCDGIVWGDMIGDRILGEHRGRHVTANVDEKRGFVVYEYNTQCIPSLIYYV